MKSWMKLLLAGLLVLPVVASAEDTNVVWESSIGAGVTYKSGNTDKSLFTFNAKADRRAKHIDFLNSLYAEYGKTEGDQTEGQVRLQSEGRRRFGEKWFAAINTEVLHDAIKDINYRIKIGPNVGYYFVNNETMKFDGSAGAVYVHEKNAAGTDDYGQWRLAENFDWKFSDTASFYFNTEFYSRMDDVKDNNLLLITGLKSKMNGHLSLFAELRDEYDSVPAGPDVKHNDVTLIAGITYDF